MRVETTRYQASHSKAPRGWGRWVFTVGGETFTYTGHYGEAKRAAFEFARTRGVRVVTVEP